MCDATQMRIFGLTPSPGLIGQEGPFPSRLEHQRSRELYLKPRKWVKYGMTAMIVIVVIVTTTITTRITIIITIIRIV